MESFTLTYKQTKSIVIYVRHKATMNNIVFGFRLIGNTFNIDLGYNNVFIVLKFSKKFTYHIKYIKYFNYNILID